MVVEEEAEPEAIFVAVEAAVAAVVEVVPWVPSILKPWKGPASFTISMVRRRGHALTGTSAP